ncbi:retrotransposon protein, putative, ty1-copia subclass [Tanacetum coccineum]
MKVENQTLCKTLRHSIKSVGGEYISQEFKDYLKANRIVQQLTPPYTPQHNGVSERRNCTLLDMVRSMMNLTTLHLSFWDYALESQHAFSYMVPTKQKGLIMKNVLTCRHELELFEFFISIAAILDYTISAMVKVCKLQRFIYGLRTGSKSWNRKDLMWNIHIKCLRRDMEAVWITALHFANEPGVQMGVRHYHRSNLLKVHTDNNLADPFTKALSNRKLTQHARSMGLRPASSFM